MQRTLLIGIGAGLAAAALYSTVISYSLLAVFLLYLAPLPLFIAGLGWGAATAALGTVVGTAAITAGTGFRGGFLFLLSVGVAPVLISYLALLSRDAGEARDREGAPEAAGRDFYPEGRLVLWTALLAGLLVTATVVMLGPDAESFRAVLRETVTRMLDTQPMLRDELKSGQVADISAFVNVFVWLMPPASAVLWLFSTLVNLYLAARIVMISGRTLRPWASFSSLAFPRNAVFLPLIAVALALLPGTVGLLGGVFLAVILAAFAILGLAVVHLKTLGMASRPILLAALYAALLIFNWIIVLALSGLGLARTAMRADRTIAGPPPPR